MAQSGGEKAPGEEVSRETSWIPEKILLYGKKVGLLVNLCSEGWDGVVKFAELRERQNQEDCLSPKSKKKGTRKLQNLTGTINYEKAREGQQGSSSSFFGGVWVLGSSYIVFVQ